MLLGAAAEEAMGIWGDEIGLVVGGEEAGESYENR